MNKFENKFKEIRKFCEANTNTDNIEKYSRYFTEGWDAYGLGMKVFMPQLDKWLEAWNDEMSMQDYLELGDLLISTGKYEEASYAISFVHSNPDELKPEMFEHFGNWLEKHVVNWGHTDVMSGKILAHFFIHHLLEIEAFNNWVNSPGKWKRRAVPVTLVELVKTVIELERIFKVIEPLMMDEEKKVQQGLGWLLRECWKKEPKKIETFLLKHKETCGRTIIQYATEKMSKEERLRFRRTKKK